jgi:hypothetical protein
LSRSAFSTGEDEDVVVWRIGEDGRARVALVLASDGRQLEMDGYALSWRWPPK